MRARNYVKGLALAMLGSALTTGYAQKEAQKPASWTKRLTQQALASGYEAKLPPHVSMVLGLAKGEAVPVKQLVSRAGQKVHTFNVSVADHRVVLFLNDEQAQSAVAYLLGPGGKLRTAVSYQAGGEPSELTGTEARSGLAREIRYWSDYAVSNPGTPPPGAPTPAAPLKPDETSRPPGGPTTP
jgi:hypothetical protein